MGVGKIGKFESSPLKLQRLKGSRFAFVRGSGFKGLIND